MQLDLFGLVVVVDTSIGGAGADMVEKFTIDGIGAMDLFLEDGFGLDGLELGLEVLERVGVRAAVGAATRIVDVVVVVFELVTLTAPNDKID